MLERSEPGLDLVARRVDFIEARALMLSAAFPLGAETIPLERSYGRIVASALHAADDIVPYARSAMDGYAVRACDTHGTRVPLRVIGASYAGDAPLEVGPGTAVAIATGAALPAGADAVVPFEHIAVFAELIVLTSPLATGDYVFHAGDDAKRGDLIARPGDVVTPGRAALLAAAGFAHISVHRRPRVAIVCTGDELVAISERPGPGMVRNSNATMLAASLGVDGADVTKTIVAKDTVQALRAALSRAMAWCDLLITTGGASAGERDLVKSTLEDIGARFAFRSVAMRPAKPCAFGKFGNTFVAVLPGNPAAAFVGYAALVRGVVRLLAGQRVPIPPALPAKLHGSIHAKLGRHYLVLGRAERDGAELFVTPLANQCSSLVRTSAEANSLIIVPPGDGDLESGTNVHVEMIPE
jgi:molybdopterin molybdotransferase